MTGKNEEWLCGLTADNRKRPYVTIQGRHWRVQGTDERGHPTSDDSGGWSDTEDGAWEAARARCDKAGSRPPSERWGSHDTRDLPSLFAKLDELYSVYKRWQPGGDAETFVDWVRDEMDFGAAAAQAGLKK